MIRIFRDNFHSCVKNIPIFGRELVTFGHFPMFIIVIENNWQARMVYTTLVAVSFILVSDIFTMIFDTGFYHREIQVTSVEKDS